MIIFKNIISSFKTAGQFPRINFFIVIIQLLLSSLIGILAYNYIQCSIGDSTNLLKIIDGYNHDVFQDLLHSEETGWTMIKSFAILIAFLYLLIGPFIMGGLLHAFNKEADRWDIFWKGGSKYYMKFLGIHVIMLVIVVILVALAGFLGITIITKGLDHFISEVPSLWMLLGVAILLLLLLITIVSISTKSKWNIIANETGVWSSLKLGVKQVTSKLWIYLGLGIVFLLISLAFAFIINMIINIVPESNFLLVTLALALQLLALYVRVWFRNSYYAAILLEEN